MELTNAKEKVIKILSSLFWFLSKNDKSGLENERSNL